MRNDSCPPDHDEADPVALTLTDAAEGDACFGKRDDGRTVLVHGPGVPGDTVEALPLRKSGKLPRYRLLRVAEPSPHRIDPVCPHFGICGGCKWMATSPEHEVALKASSVENALRRLGGFDTPPLRPLLPAPSRLAYRNKLELVPLPDQERWGLHALGDSQRTVALDACAIAHPLLSEGLLHLEEVPELTQTMSRASLRLHRGEAVILVLHGQKPPTPAQLKALSPFAGIWWKGEKSDKPARRLCGPETLVQPQGDIAFQLLPTAFFQINPRQTEVVLQLVLAAAAEVDSVTSVVDLFCGAGLFALHLATPGRSVTGLELAGDGLASAALTQAALPADHPGRQVEFREADLTLGLPPSTPDTDLVIVDPPRAGCSPALLDQLAASSWKRLIYVSCNPATLARDLKRLAAEPGVAVTTVTPVDCFPNTGHVEGVALVDRISE